MVRNYRKVLGPVHWEEKGCGMWALGSRQEDVSVSSKSHRRASRVGAPTLHLLLPETECPSYIINHNNGYPNESQADRLLIAGEKKLR